MPIVYTLHEYLPICAHHGQMIKTKTHALCSKASPSDCGVCFPEIGAGNMLRRELFVKSFFAEVDAFVSPSHFLLSRFADWGLPQDKLVMIENGLEGGTVTPPRPAAQGAPRNRFAYFGQLNPFKGIKVLVDAVTRVPASVWGDSVLYVYGGNLEHQPDEFQAQVKELFRIAGNRVRFRGIVQEPRAARPDARGRLDDRALDLVGELAGGDPGGVLPRPPGHRLGHRRHGREGAPRHRRAAFPRRLAPRAWPSRWRDAIARAGCLGPAARAASSRR